VQEKVQQMISEGPVSRSDPIHCKACEGQGSEHIARCVGLKKQLQRMLGNLGIALDVQLVVHGEAVEKRVATAVQWLT
jgi:hypothetical protein